MNITKIGICSASSPDKKSNFLLKNSLNTLKIPENIKIYDLFVPNNTVPLPKIYNNAIKKSIEEDLDALLLIHDDVVLEDSDFFDKVKENLSNYDLIGVAGTSKIALNPPALWHIMGGGFGSGHLHGSVNHEYDGNPKSSTNFGKYPHRVIMIDGVFMGLNKKMIHSGVKFDEKNPSQWHFYDLQFSLDAHLNNLKVGVSNILITHMSPGLRSFTPEWESGQKWFLEKYNN